MWCSLVDNQLQPRAQTPALAGILRAPRLSIGEETILHEQQVCQRTIGPLGQLMLLSRQHDAGAQLGDVVEVLREHRAVGKISHLLRCAP
jgi:hypothetical protein